MRRAPFLGLLALWFLCAALRVAAHIVTLGEITKVGLWDDNPMHIALLMEGGDVRSEMTLTSQDGGSTWLISAADLPPEKLRPLPQEGAVQYRVAWLPSSEDAKPLGGHTLIRSADGGLNWTDISPWGFLRGKLRDKIEARKTEYLAKYGHWLPSYDDNWLLAFSVSVGLLLLVGGWVLWRQKQAVLSPVLLSGACALVGVIAFSAIHHFGAYLFTVSQWEGMFVWTSGWIDAPRWPWGLAMHLTVVPRHIVRT